MVGRKGPGEGKCPLPNYQKPRSRICKRITMVHDAAVGRAWQRSSNSKERIGNLIFTVMVSHSGGLKMSVPVLML